MQALIWGVALAACAAFAGAVFVVTGRGRPVLPAPETIRVGPEVAPRQAEAVAQPAPTAPAPKSAAAPTEPAGTAVPTPATPAPPPAKPRELTEDLFIELSAQMLVAADAFTSSEVGKKSFERACEGILGKQGVSRPEFDQFEAQIAQDPQRQARVVDRVLERADQMRHHPTNVRVHSSPQGVVDPHRPSPTPTPPH
jgi:hypothetical protein